MFALGNVGFPQHSIVVLKRREKNVNQQLCRYTRLVTTGCHLDLGQDTEWASECSEHWAPKQVFFFIK